MAEKIKKTIWAKLTKLSDKDLDLEGKEIEWIKKEEKKKKVEELPKKEDWWLPQIAEGKLSLDIYQKNGKIIVKSPIAGVKSEDLEIIIDKDILTIKGERKKYEEVDEKNYFHRECFWGKFSRTVILPTKVEIENVKASLKNGILTIILPIKKEEEEIKKIKPKK